MNRYNTIFTCLTFSMILTLNTTMNAIFQMDGHMGNGNGSVNINNEKVCGKGHIEGSNISITCNEFTFRGTITCNKECTIRCKKPFNYNDFIKKGSGSFTVIISPYDFEECTQDALSNYSQNLFLKNVEGNNKESLNEQVEQIRYYAVSNKIDEKPIFDSVFKKIDETIAYHKDRINSEDTELHKKKIDQLTTIKENIGKVIAKSFVLKKEQVIKLQ